MHTLRVGCDDETVWCDEECTLQVAAGELLSSFSYTVFLNFPEKFVY